MKDQKKEQTDTHSSAEKDTKIQDTESATPNTADTNEKTAARTTPAVDTTETKEAPAQAESQPSNPPVTADAPVSEKKSSSFKTIASFIAGVLVVLLVYVFITTDRGVKTGDEYKAEAVVAKVNGEKILGNELNQQVQQFALMRGIEDTENMEAEMRENITAQALDALINTELIVQAARRDGMEVTPEEVQAEYDRIIESIGGEAAAEERFAALGATTEIFKAGLEDELLVTKYMLSAVDEENTTPTQEEIEATYNQSVAGMAEDVPSLEEVSAVIAEQLEIQKQQEALAAILQELRDGAMIEKQI